MSRATLLFILVVGGLIALGYLGKLGFDWHFGLSKLPTTVYEPTVWGRSVAKVFDNLPGITRVKLTPDEWTMFATTLDGNVWVANNVDNEGQYILQNKPIYSLPLGWTPGSENGMTGLAVSYDFALDHYVFVSYAKKIGSTGRSYIDRLTLERKDEKWRVAAVRNIFVGNTPVIGAHQIQGMITVPVEDRLHVMFTIGEAYHPEYSQDLAREAGKVMMITADGGDPLGVRPYPAYPKIQAMGLRNAYDLARNELNNWVYISDNGPDANDRILYAPILDNTKQFDFGWNDTAEGLLHPRVNGEVNDSLVIHVWPVTVSPTSLAVDTLGRFYVTIFSSVNYPKKEIWMGEVSKAGRVAMTKILQRRTDAGGGNLIGIAMSNENGNIWFADLSDGALYLFGRSWEIVRALGK